MNWANNSAAPRHFRCNHEFMIWLIAIHLTRQKARLIQITECKMSLFLIAKSSLAFAQPRNLGSVRPLLSSELFPPVAHPHVPDAQRRFPLPLPHRTFKGRLRRPAGRHPQRDARANAKDSAGRVPVVAVRLPRALRRPADD